MNSARKLSPGHFAFMRAVVQGLDLASWERYLALEGTASDLRRVKSTIAWTGAELAASARRHTKPGTARLVLMDAEHVADNAPSLPSLAEFAAERGLGEFSEASSRRPSSRPTVPNRRGAAIAARPPDPAPVDAYDKQLGDPVKLQHRGPLRTG